jgi:beta-lactamase regulating signal transducer with metallopeptidase domain
MAAEAMEILLRVNLAAGAAVLLALALRGPMRAMFGARVAYALWWIVPAAVVAVMLPARTVEMAPVAAAVAPAADVVVAPGGAAPVAVAAVDWTGLAAVLWLAGVAGMLAVLALRQRAFMASLGRLEAEPGAAGVLRAEAAGIGPAIVGAVRPKLVLPKDFEARFDAVERDVVLAHERVHLTGGDARINGIVALAQCVCWFNPLAHIAAHVMRIDQELACDAAVAARYPKSRRVYAEAMLKTQIAPLGLPLGCYWPPGGAHPLKLRIAMLKRELPGARRIALGAGLAALASVGTGCVVWAAQPPREVVAAISSVSAAQAAHDDDLLRALWRGDVRRAEAAIASGADVNVRTQDGMTALAIVARADDLQLVNLLLQNGADPNLISAREGNALASAARRGQYRSVVALVEHGAEIDRVAPGFGTPLTAAVRTGQLQVMKYLVEHGADVNLPSPLPAPWDRWGAVRTPLYVAIGSDDRSMIDYLKSKGATM